MTAVNRLALVSVELALDGGLCISPVGVSGELRVTSFADPEGRNVSSSLYDPEIALGHLQSLAHREGLA